MNTLRDYVNWKLTHPQGYMSRNIFHKDIVSLKTAGWYLDRSTAIVTDKSITAYGTATANNGLLNCYLGELSELAGKTISMTFTPMTEFTNTSTTALVVTNKSFVNIASGKNVAWDGGYHSCITIPEEPEEGSLFAIRLYGQKLTEGAEVKIDNIMIYEGSEPLPYEPYGKFIKK